ncbi:MAG: HAMP domain-containing sensor histidine kinase [Chloroflexota bacterium]
MVKQIFSNSLRLKLMTAYGLLSVFAILCVYGLVYVILFLGGSILYNIQRLNKVEEALVTHLEAGGELDEFREFFAREVIQGPIAAIPQPRLPIIVDGEVVGPEAPLRPPPSEEGEAGRPPPPPGPRPRPFLNDTISFGVVDLDRTVVQPFAGNRYGEVVPDDYDGTIYPVTFEGELVAYIYTNSRFDWILGPEGLSGPVFSSAVLVISRSLPVALVIGLLSAMGIGSIWARLLITPITGLRDAAGKVSSGSLGISLPVRTQDEVGRLISSFNQMSNALAKATEAKKQLTMEIATTLNSPMGAASDMINAIRSGKAEMTPIQLQKIVGELNQMDQLIEDLNLLSQVDTNRLVFDIQRFDIGPFLEEVAEEYVADSSNQALHLEYGSSDQTYSIRADRGFLKQSLIKILRHVFMQTKSSGQVALSVGLITDEFVTLLIHLIGLPKHTGQAPHLIERESQTANEQRRETHTIGLGLTISEELIGAMGGTIRASSQLGNQGDLFRITLPTG